MYIMYMSSFTFLLVHCGSLVSTLVLSSETECPVALQWSPTPVGMVRLFSKWAFGFTYVHVCRVLIACYLVYDPTLLVFRRLVFRVYEDGT